MSKVVCMICGNEFSRIGNHLPKHSMTVEEYKNRFPDAKTCAYTHSEETKQKMKGKRPIMCGRTFSIETRTKISNARKKFTGWQHSEETKEKMRQSWLKRKSNVETYSKYVQMVSERMKTPETVARLRAQNAKNIINGVHNGKSKGTSLEKRFITFLENNCVDYIHQFSLTDHNNGVFLYDFHLPDMNMLVEVDGEYWHRKPEQYNRDKIKHKLAKTQWYRFVRISDKLWKPEMIFENDQAIDVWIDELMNIRQLNLYEAKKPVPH